MTNVRLFCAASTRRKAGITNDTTIANCAARDLGPILLLLESPGSRRRSMGPRSRAAQLAIVVSLVIPAFLLVEAAQKSRTLVINGHPGAVAVIERECHAYVEI